MPRTHENPLPRHHTAVSLVLVICIVGLVTPVYGTSPSIHNAPPRSSPTRGLLVNPVMAAAANDSVRTYGLGLLHDQIPKDARVTPLYAAALPTHFDWRQKDGYNWMTPVKDQVSCGSCVAFAAVGATEGQLKIRANSPSWNVDLSEQHLFSCGGGLCWLGWYISSALNRLRDYGTPDEACSPYQSGDGSDRSCPTKCVDGSDWQPRAYKISSWNWISNSPSAIEAALMNGPLVGAFDVYYDFFGYSGGVYHYDGHSQYAGGHAIVIVGYDSNDRYWIVKNSWGNWGESGYFRIGFGEVGIEQEVASISVSITTATVTVALTRTSTSYAYGTTTRTDTSYTATSITSTSTIPTATTVVLVPLTVTSTIQSVQYLTSILTTTVTNYTAAQTSTSTIPTVTTVVLLPLIMTSMAENIQYLTSILTTTVTNYTATEISTSTVVVPTTVTVGQSTANSTVQTTQVLTETGTTTVTSETTTTSTSYTATETSTSTTVAYTTVTGLASIDASNPLIYFGFVSLLALTHLSSRKRPRRPSHPAFRASSRQGRLGVEAAS